MTPKRKRQQRPGSWIRFAFGVATLVLWRVAPECAPIPFALGLLSCWWPD